MSFIEILAERCSECGICIMRCPACFTSDSGRIALRDDAKRCISCGHCVALCPEDAIAHHGFEAHTFAPIPPLSDISVKGFESVVQRRRSHRHFLDKPIPDDLLRRIVDCCRYAPTGVNTQDVSIKVVRTRTRVRAISKLAVDHFVSAFESLDREAAALTDAGRPVPASLQEALRRNARYRRMGVSFEKGFDPIFHHAPAVLLFHAPAAAPTPRADCIIAAHTAVLHAELLGLGSCYIGLFTRAAAEQPDILAKLALPPEDQLYAAIILGFPSLRFLKIPPRLPIKTTWE